MPFVEVARTGRRFRESWLADSKKMRLSPRGVGEEEEARVFACRQLEEQTLGPGGVIAHVDGFRPSVPSSRERRLIVGELEGVEQVFAHSQRLGAATRRVHRGSRLSVGHVSEPRRSGKCRTTARSLRRPFPERKGLQRAVRHRFAVRGAPDTGDRAKGVREVLFDRGDLLVGTAVRQRRPNGSGCAPVRWGTSQPPRPLPAPAPRRTQHSRRCRAPAHGGP